MKKLIFLIFIIVLINLVLAQECSTEIKDVVSTSTQLCKQEYDITNTIQIGSNMIFDCNGATLIGTGMNSAFLLQDTQNSEIKNCNLVNFQSGFYLDKADNNKIHDNSILDSKVYSIYILNSNDNDIYSNKINTELSYDELSVNDFCVKGLDNEYLGALIGPGCGETVKLDNVVTGSQLDIILNQISEGTGIKKGELFENYKRTLSKVTIRKSVLDNRVTISIAPKQKLSFDVYEFIPKDTLKTTDLMDIGDAKIVNKDPLIMWSFVNANAVDVSYDLPNSIVSNPKTIIIETVTSVSDVVGDADIVDSGNDDSADLNNGPVDNVDQQGNYDNGDVADEGTNTVNHDATKTRSNTRTNAILTAFVLILICVIVIYLIRKSES